MEFAVINTTQVGEMVYDSIIEKLYSFLSLEEGWNYGEGESIDISVVYKAEELYYLISSKGFETDVFPTLNGGVNLSFSSKRTTDNFIEITIEKNGNITLVREKRIGSNANILFEKENAIQDDIIQLIHQIENECIFIAYLISGSTIMSKKDDFNLQHFKGRRMVVEYLSSYKSVLKKQEHPLVITFNNITPKSQVIQLST